MAYEAEGRRIAVELQARFGKLIEARLGRPITLVFELGEWEVPGNFIFKFGYGGSGPDCFHAFLSHSGFDIPKSAVENAKEGTVFVAPGHDPKEETCPKCGRSFPIGTLVNVFILEGAKTTQRLLCRECGTDATKSLYGLEIKPKH